MTLWVDGDTHFHFSLLIIIDADSNIFV